MVMVLLMLSWGTVSIGFCHFPCDTSRARSGSKSMPLTLIPVLLMFYPEGANRKKNLPPKVPITPMPRYSIMETPVLKKELDRLVVFLQASASVVSCE